MKLLKHHLIYLVTKKTPIRDIIGNWLIGRLYSQKFKANYLRWADNLKNLPENETITVVPDCSCLDDVCNLGCPYDSICMKDSSKTIAFMEKEHPIPFLILKAFNKIAYRPKHLSSIKPGKYKAKDLISLVNKLN